MNENEFPSIGDVLIVVQDYTQHIKEGDELVVVSVDATRDGRIHGAGEPTVALSGCRCSHGSHKKWKDGYLWGWPYNAKYFKVKEFPISAEEAKRAATLPSAHDVRDFFKKP